jgi:hypothetical protein
VLPPAGVTTQFPGRLPPTARPSTFPPVASKKRRALASTSNRGKRRKRIWWENLSNEELLAVRICDLELVIPGTALQSRIKQLYDELRRAGIKFRPHIWLSTDWFTPDAITGFAVPFFLAHPRLARIEHRQMLEVEGGNQTWCMKLLRHETGHAIDNAYRLHWKKKWRETFGRFSESYDHTYAPNPISRDHVQHLGYWYSQSHPAEDFAESFAVWMRPGGRWRSRYKDWPVLSKLTFIDDLMNTVGHTKPVVQNRSKPDSLSTLRMTISEYYDEKKRTYTQDEDDEIADRYLRQMFSDDPAYRSREAAATFLRRFQAELRNRVASLTRQPKYLVEQALNVLLLRSRELGLRVMHPTSENRIDATILITILTMQFVHDKKTHYQR